MKRLDVPAVQAVTTYIKDKYGIEGDLPFSEDFDDLAFRHQDNKKWFALLILVDRQRFFPDEEAGEMYLLNLKSDPKKIMFLYDDHVHPAYHMNKRNWISILLDEGTNMKTTKRLIDESYALTAKKKMKSKNHHDDF